MASPASPINPVAAAKARYNPRSFGIALTVALVAATLVIAVLLWSKAEEQRATASWRDRLNYVADGKQKEISGWVQGQFKGLSALADNASLQVYMSTASAGGDAEAELTFLRNLLTHTAENMGFDSSAAARTEALKANVNSIGHSGIALVDMSGKQLAATAGMPPLEGALLKSLQDAPRGESTLIDFSLTPEGTAQIGFIVPVYGIQSDRDPSEQLGAVLAVKEVEKDAFLKLMEISQSREYPSMRASLVRLEGGQVVYISPQTGTPPLSKQVAVSNATQLDSLFVIKETGAFAEKQDDTGTPVLVTGRAIAGTPWSLVVAVDKAEALKENIAWRNNGVAIALLLVGILSALLFAVWKNASSRRSYELALESSRLASHSAAQEKLLRLVTNNQPESIYIVDKQHKFWFANSTACNAAKIAPADILGKTMENVFGPARAQEIIEANIHVLQTSSNLSTVRRVSDEDKVAIVRSEHICLPHIPVDSLPDPTPGVLVVEHDITEIMNERERRGRTMRQLIDTLVMLVDQRDPFSANHSAYVAQIARDIASEMQLDPLVVETTEIAGKLMNIGKIIISPELLTKRESLNENEMRTIRNSVTTSADLLRNIDFNGPVVETLRQSQELFDGSGPQKLKGEDILPSARIIAVANAFVGMISPRSYRSAISVDEATKILLENINSKYDRRAVVALINNIENHGGKESLKLFATGNAG